jgi:hypothetical protein
MTFGRVEDIKGVIRIRKRVGTDNTMAKRKGHRDKQRSTNTTQKTKARAIRTPLKSGGALKCSGRVVSSCSTSGTRRVTLITNQVINHE